MTPDSAFLSSSPVLPRIGAADSAVFRPFPSYRGRFAPSPSGPLHLGSLVAAMASWLDARAHHGQWLVRIEDIDPPREVPGASQDILATLADFGFVWTEAPLFQSRHGAAYQAAFEQLMAAGWLYPCACSRKEIADSQTHRAHSSLIYPGTCRNGLQGDRQVRAWRMRTAGPDAATRQDQSGAPLRFNDRALGWQEQDLEQEVGDFVLKRADGLWAYQLAVVVDDAAQGITDVVRGADLLDSTARQIHLQRALHLPAPSYLHVPVVENNRGEKLSKQTGATALNRQQPLAQLRAAAQHLNLPVPQTTRIDAFWEQATVLWRERWTPASAVKP